MAAKTISGEGSLLEAARPNKLALLERLPRSVPFVRPGEGAIAARLHEHGNAGVFAPGPTEATSRWVEQWFRRQVNSDAGQQGPLPTCAGPVLLLRRWLTECESAAPLLASGDASSYKRGSAEIPHAPGAALGWPWGG